MAAHHRCRDALKVGRFHIAEERVAMQSLRFPIPSRSTTSGILALKDFSGKCPAWVLRINNNTQPRRYLKQSTPQLYPILIPESEVRQDQPIRQLSVLRMP